MTLERANVALAILLVLLTLGLAMPALLRAQRAADRESAVNNLKGITLAMQSYHDEWKQLPPAFDRAPQTTTLEAISYPVSLHVRLLPYVDQRAVFETFLIEGKGDTNAVIAPLIAPNDGSLAQPDGVQNFAANLRLFSEKGRATRSAEDMPALARVEPGSRLTMVGITRGVSNTIAFATKLANCGTGGSRYAADPASPFAAFFGQNAARTTAHYSNPQSTYQWAPRGEECLCKPLMAQTYWPAPIITGWADGTVRALPGDVNPGFWNACLHPNGD